MEIDELQIYRGADYKITDNIIIHQPTLNEICDYGEKEYYQMMHSLTSVPADSKWQLSDGGYDYTQINEFDFFYGYLVKQYPQSKTYILFGDLDFTKFQIIDDKENNRILLIQNIGTEEIPNIVVVDEYTYILIMDYLRKMHGIKKNEQKPANEYTKQILIEDAREEYERNKNKEYHSQLRNLVSSMVNSEGFKFSHNEVWDMKINAFMDSVYRISKIKNAELLLQSGYSGYGINLKNIDKKQLDWLGELE